MSADKPTLNASGVAHNAKNDRPDLLKSAQCIQARPHSSGFKSFLNWFKKVEKLQRQRDDDEDEDDDSATDASSVSSDSSTATVASFAFLEPNVYKPYGDALQPEKYIASGPYTDTYNRLILERDRRRNLDKNVTLRKKYQLYSSGLTLNGTLKPGGAKSNFTTDEDDKIKIYDTFSLPAMNKINSTNLEFQNKEHRRAASETKFVRPLSYVHVKGKRRAPLPPGCTLVRTNRKKRAAPPPPISTEAKDNSAGLADPVSPTSIPSPEKSPDSIKPVLYHSKSEEVAKAEMAELSPRPWYKRQFSDNKGKSKKVQNDDSKTKHKTELPEIGFFRYSKIFDTKKNVNSDFSANEKRISGIHILPNISELDREANEIISMHKKFIREENNNESNPKIENLANPRSARELITKFNAMQKTNALPSQPNILLDSELIPNKKVLLSPTKLCENEVQKSENKNKKEETVQKSENKKEENVQVEGKTEIGNWICAKCKYQNKSFQHICSICYNRKAEPVVPTKVTDNLFKSFEAEVFDALSHLGNMSEGDVKNAEIKVSPSSENNVSSSSEKKVSLSNENKVFSSSGNKVSSSSENKMFSSSENKVSSCNENNVFSSSENKVSSSSGNKVSSSSDNHKNLLNDKEEEKQKLRELLKEMKNSLPKRPKSAIVTSYTSNNSEKIQIQSTAEVNGPKIVDVNISTKIEPAINVKSEANIGINPLYKPKVESVSSDIKTNHVEKLDKIIKKTSNKTDSSAQTNDFKISTSVNNTQPVITENLYANIGDKIAIATKKTNSDGQVNQNVKDLKDPKVLLRKLETAISKGDDIAAATIARQLAILKISCTVLSSLVTEASPTNSVNVEIYIEDQDSHHGPIQLNVGKEINIAELKQSVAKELNIPINIQRWIVGKQLAVDETQPLSHYNKNDFSQPMFLYLVSPTKEDVKAVDTKQNENLETTVKLQKDITIQEFKKESPIKDLSAPCSSKVIGNSSKDADNAQKVAAKKSADHYLELVNLDSQVLIKNMITFECAICFLDCKVGDGVVLRECLHSFCKECLANTIRFSEEVEIKCPFRDYSYSCESVIQEREIKALVPKDAFEQHLAKSVTVAENSMQKTFHCKSADCKGWCIYEDNVNYFRCPVCRKTNCLTCQAIHDGENCKQYQERIKQNSESDPETLDGQRTKQMLEDMVNKGDAMVCPSCQVVLMKKWGCDWLRCSMCKTEICWVTRGPRWGSAGKGDTTGGCQCGVNGVKCHPKCNYCH